MNAPHWHLALNHFPVVGMFFTTALLAFALWRKGEELIRASLGFLVVVALTCLPVFFTGLSAEKTLMEAPGFEETLADAHHTAATIGFVAAAIAGVVALAALLVFRKAPALPRWVKLVLLALALTATALLGWTANLGGMIRHPEIRSDSAAAQG